MRIEKQVEIDAPIREVFDFIRDPDNDPVWCPTVLDSTQVEGDGPVPGAVYRQHHKPGPGKPTELMVELLEVDPPRMLELKSTDHLGWFRVWYHLEELPGGGTRLTQVDETHFQGIGRLLRPLLFVAIHAGISRQFSTLKEMLEADDPRTDSARRGAPPAPDARAGNAPTGA